MKTAAESQLDWLRKRNGQLMSKVEKEIDDLINFRGYENQSHFAHTKPFIVNFPSDSEKFMFRTYMASQGFSVDIPTDFRFGDMEIVVYLFNYKK